jgi:zinc protease
MEMTAEGSGARAARRAGGRRSWGAWVAASAAAWAACAPASDAERVAGTPGGLTLDYERYELANGLDVILHVDRSDPIAAVAMTFHVGSAREVEGRTGFAHLFEHLFFLDSENLGPGGLDRLMTRIGSSTNGSTNRDRTNYFEVVPIDGLEKTLWAEADKLGFFIHTVSESVVAKEKQVVKNEKRQGVDNQPYGHVSDVVDRAIFPDGHPYRWQVIGSLEDLDAASLGDVQAFHARWYGPDNATLVVAGDLDVAATRAWIETYFGEIPARATPERAEPPAVAVAADVRLVHEDNFANLPMLTLAWPGVALYRDDAYALEVLAALLTDGKTTPFYEVVVEEEELAPSVEAFHDAEELAGVFTLRVRAYAGKDLDDVLAAVERAFARFEQEGVPPDELERVKAGAETAFYRNLSSVLGKAFQLAQYSIFAGDPGYAQEDLRRTLAVSADDVLRVYESYLRGRPKVAASFVPRGAAELALEGSDTAAVVEEPIVAGAEAAFVVVRGEGRPTPSAFDRTVEPPFGPAPSLTAPQVWRDSLANGLALLGVEDHETPLVQFALRFEGGQLFEDPGAPGAANLLAETLTQGTRNRTPEELEHAIDLLGASIEVRSDKEELVLIGSTLARNYEPTLALVQEILLEPRWDPEELELARQRVANQLRQRAAVPGALAADVFDRLLYGDHVLGGNPLGTPASVEALGLEDLQAYHRRVLVPGGAALHVAGAVTPASVRASLTGLESRWTGEAPAAPAPPAWDPARAGLYLVDVPNAAQSVLAIGYLALAQTDEDFYPATLMNFRLGGGGFASDLTQELREGKGYTYGIRSAFSGTTRPGAFAITSSVRSNVTYESLALVKTIMERHGPGFDDDDLEATRSFLLRANARAFETLGAKLGLLADMSAYGFPADYVLRREDVVRAMTVERVRALAERYLEPESMVWLVVGDARTQAPRLAALGLGEPRRVDRSGLPVR